MIVIGLTGSIGMGKTTAGKMLGRIGIPVHDADAAVHEVMHFPDGIALPKIYDAFPYWKYAKIYKLKGLTKLNIDRKALGDLVFHNEEERKKLENILHPLVRQSQDHFKKKHKKMGADIVALDIPLLFETGADLRVDYTAVVSAPAHIQTSRVLSRPGMSEEKFRAILKRQVPDGEKCARADYVLKTGLGMAHTMRQVKAMIGDIRNKNENALNLTNQEKTENQERYG